MVGLLLPATLVGAEDQRSCPAFGVQVCNVAGNPNGCLYHSISSKQRQNYFFKKINNTLFILYDKL